jgi:hypothetical protein
MTTQVRRSGWPWIVRLPLEYWLPRPIVAGADRNGGEASGAAALTGFCDQSHLTRGFMRITGTTPGEYRRDRTNVQDED